MPLPNFNTGKDIATKHVIKYTLHASHTSCGTYGLQTITPASMLTAIRHRRLLLLMSVILFAAAGTLAFSHGLAVNHDDHGDFTCNVCQWSAALACGHAAIAVTFLPTISRLFATDSASPLNPRLLRPTGRSPPSLS